MIDHSTDAATAIELLRHIAARLDSMQGDIANAVRPRAGTALSRADRASLAALVGAIWAAIGSADFVVNELIEHATTSEPLKMAIDAAVGQRSSPARALGKLLRRGEGVVIDGVVVQGLATVRSGVLWRVERVRV